MLFMFLDSFYITPVWWVPTAEIWPLEAHEVRGHTQLRPLHHPHPSNTCWMTLIKALSVCRWQAVPGSGGHCAARAELVFWRDQLLCQKRCQQKVPSISDYISMFLFTKKGDCILHMRCAVFFSLSKLCPKYSGEICLWLPSSVKPQRWQAAWFRVCACAASLFDEKHFSIQHLGLACG